MTFHLWITLLLLLIPALAAPTATTSCNLYNAKLSLPSGQTVLVAPTSAPSFVAVAIGVQNYTCDATSQTYSNVGAVAELFDISCFYSTSTFSSIQDDLYTIWSASPSGYTAQEVISGLEDNSLVLGQHYYVPNPTGGAAVSPKWDFTSNARKGNTGAFVVGAKVANLPGPISSTDLDWVQWKNVEGGLANAVYRVDTKGGQAPTSCTPGSPLLSVRYTAKYWLFG